MRRRQTLILAVGVAALWGCGTDTLTAPRPTPKGAAKDCSTQLYSDPTTCSDFGDGGYTYTDLNDYGSATVEFTMVGTPPGGPNTPVLCPAFYKSLVPATLSPNLAGTVTVISSGWFVPQTPNTTVGRATYNWPPGWWPSTDGSGREANIKTASAVCYVGRISGGLWTVFVNFYYFVGSIRQGSSGNTSGGGGGGGGGNISCETEFITVEVDNGAGWQTFWSGYAQVCS
jgi:hypothetical protein